MSSYPEGVAVPLVDAVDLLRIDKDNIKRFPEMILENTLRKSARKLESK